LSGGERRLFSGYNSQSASEFLLRLYPNSIFEESDTQRNSFSFRIVEVAWCNLYKGGDGIEHGHQPEAFALI